jgi:dihydrofolate synthase/folylpolyglutamate synthase
VEQLDPLNSLEQRAIAQVNATLASFGHFGVELGLERIQRLLANLDNPQQQVPIIHVAGSNGKGSVCAYLSSVLLEAGYRVGRYTSPHLVSWCERIWINGKDISAVALQAALAQVLAAIQPDAPSPTQFEVITAAAWLYFAQQQVDVVVMEVGLGGRLDATNVCDRPLVSVITSISREHWQRLGPTLADIAREKAGILKPGCPAVVGVLPPEATESVQQRVQAVNCPVFWVHPSVHLGSGQAQFQGMQSTPIQTELDQAPGPAEAFTYPLPLLGPHQLMNSALAIATLQILQQQGWLITPDQMQRGLAQTQWTARLQWYTWRGRSLLIDAAHNSAGARALRQYLDEYLASSIDAAAAKSPIIWVIGMLANKDHAEVFEALLRPGDRLHGVPVPDHQTVEPADLVAIAQRCCPQLAEVQIHRDAVVGLESVLEQLDPEIAPTPTVVLCGSIYMIGEVLKRMEELQPRAIISSTKGDLAQTSSQKINNCNASV